jgi:hypothetical protein
MANISFFNTFNIDLVSAKHDFSSTSSQVFNVCLTRNAPVASGVNFADLTEISPGNGYVSGGKNVGSTHVAMNPYIDGLAAVYIDADVTFTATGGDIGPFRYLVLYNATRDRLVCYWDYGSDYTIRSGIDFPIDFSQPSGIFALRPYST